MLDKIIQNSLVNLLVYFAFYDFSQRDKCHSQCTILLTILNNVILCNGPFYSKFGLYFLHFDHF